MKKIVLAIYLTVITIFSYSQVKNKNKKPVTTVDKKVLNNTIGKVETEEWIKEKIEGFSNSYNTSEILKNITFNYWGSHKYEVEYIEEFIIIKHIWYSNDPGFNDDRTEVYFTFTYKAPIKQLSKLEITKRGGNYEINFKIKSNLNLIMLNSVTKSKIYNNSSDKLIKDFTLQIPEKFLNNNLPDRLIDGFNNLIFINGGKVTKEVF